MCDFDEMAVTPPGEFRGNDRYESYTKNFAYLASVMDVQGNAEWGRAYYRKEDVCFCYLQTGEIVFTQDPEMDLIGAASIDYKSILPVREVSYGDCGCY